MPEHEQESADLIDYRKMKDHIGFVFGSVRRHKLLATVMFTLVVAGTGTGLVVFPKSYRVEARLLLEPNPLLPSVGETGRALLDAEARSLRSAADMITRQDNLVSLIQRTDLLNYWPRHRAPALRLKDFLVRKLLGEKSEKERLDALVDFLRKRLHVWHGEGSRPNQGTVNISIDWPDGQMAFRLVEAAQQGFIEARRVAEVSAIAEATSILETHASSWRAEVVKAEEELRRVRGSKGGQAAPPGRSAPRPAPGQVREVPDPGAARLNVLLAAKRRLIDDLEDLRRRNLADLQRRLAEQQAVYTVHHPIVINIQRSIDALSQESPQVTALRKEEKALEAELMKHRSKSTDSTAELPPLPDEVLRIERELRGEVEDPPVEYARTRLTFTLDMYRNLRARADSAKLALEATLAAFKYQYTVVRPAEPPKAPTKPHIAAISAAAVVAGLLLAAFAAVFADLRAGRIVESWQVERVLGLPVLSEVREL